MNRVIKFRAWDVHEECFIDIKSIGTMEEGHRKAASLWYLHAVDEKEKDIDPPYFLDEPNDIALMQFTGLHDKNGVEIYEGDVIQAVDLFKNTGIYEVSWNSSFGGWGLKTYKLDTSFPQEMRDNGFVFAGTFSIYEDIEIIGNIYQHPTLLEGSK